MILDMKAADAATAEFIVEYINVYAREEQSWIINKVRGLPLPYLKCSGCVFRTDPEGGCDNLWEIVAENGVELYFCMFFRKVIG